MPPEIPCPDVEELRRFMLGAVREPRAALLEEHLTRCECCDGSVDTLIAEDALVQTMRTQAGFTPAPETERLVPLIERAQRLWPRSSPDLVNRQEAVPPCPTNSDTIAAPRPISDTDGEAIRDEMCACLSPPQAADELGRLGHYRIRSVLGAGGMGVVFRAEDLHLRRPVALKTLRPAVAATPSFRQRFLREARAAAALNHDHIIPIYQVGEEGSVPFLAMPLLEGETLEERLRRDGKLPLAEVLRIGREIATGLAAAHERGLIHRDIKPANVWLEAGAGRVKILDFGLARAEDEESALTRTGTITGTPGYLAPEQARAEPVDYRADLFSLGCVLYRLATGQTPFHTANTLAYLRALELDKLTPPRDLAPELPAALDRLLQRLLARDRTERPESAAEVVGALRAIEQEADAASRRDPRPAVTRSKAGWVALAGVIVLGLGAMTLLAQQIILRVRDKDGRPTEVPVPPGGNVEVVKDGQVVGRFQAGDNALHPGQISGPLARLRREDIPATERFPWQPDELVAVFGTHAWRSWFVNLTSYNPEAGVVSLVFAPDSRQLIALDRYGAYAQNPLGPNGDTAKTWDAATGKELHRFTQRKASRMLLLPETRTVALFAGDVSAWTWKLWDLDTGKEKLELIMDQVPPMNVAASPDGKLIFGGQETRLRLWDAITGNELPSLPAPVPPDAPAILGDVVGASFSPDSKLLAIAYNEVGGPPEGRRSTTLKLYDVTARKEVGSAHEEGVEFHGRPVFTPDGTGVLVCRLVPRNDKDPYSVRLWNLTAKKWGPLNVPGGSFAVSPDGKRVAVSAFWWGDWGQGWNSDACKPGIYDSATGERVVTFDGPPVTNALAFSPDGKRVAGVDNLGDILVYDAATGKPLTPRPDPFTFLAVSGDGTLMAVPEPRYTRRGATALRLVETATGKVRSRLRVPETQGIQSAALSADGKILAALNHEALQLYDTSSGERIQALGDVNTPTNVAFSANGQWLVCRVAGGADKQLKVWDTATWKEKGAIPAPNDLNVVVAISPDAQRVAAECGIYDKFSLKLFDLATGKESFSQASRQWGGGPYALSPNWERVAFDGKLFDVTMGKEITTLKVAGRPPTNLIFDSDGKSLFGSDEDGRIIRWSAGDGSVRKEWRLGGRIQRLALTADGRHLFVSNQNGTVYVLRPAPTEGASR